GALPSHCVRKTSPPNRYCLPSLHCFLFRCCKTSERRAQVHIGIRLTFNHVETYPRGIPVRRHTGLHRLDLHSVECMGLSEDAVGIAPIVNEPVELSKRRKLGMHASGLSLAQRRKRGRIGTQCHFWPFDPYG